MVQPSPAIELYSAEVCPYAQRTRMLLHEKGIEYRLHEIDLAHKPDGFERISPYGKVPLLIRGTDRVFESAIINEYLEECFPVPALMPSAAFLRAQVRVWIAFCDGRLLPTYYRLLMAQERDERGRQHALLLELWRFLEREALATLGSNPYFLGSELSLVDIAFYPFFERLPVWHHYRGVELPSDCPRLTRWLAAMSDRDCARATGHGAEFYLPRYARYADGSADGRTARDLRAGLAM